MKKNLLFHAVIAQIQCISIKILYLHLINNNDQTDPKKLPKLHMNQSIFSITYIKSFEVKQQFDHH